MINKQVINDWRLLVYYYYTLISKTRGEGRERPGVDPVGQSPVPEAGFLGIGVEEDPVLPAYHQALTEGLLVQGLAHAERVVVEEAAVDQQLQLVVLDASAGLRRSLERQHYNTECLVFFNGYFALNHVEFSILLQIF